MASVTTTLKDGRAAHLSRQPENGTVTYTYYAGGLPQSKTDAKGLQTYETEWFGSNLTD